MTCHVPAAPVPLPAPDHSYPWRLLRHAKCRVFAVDDREIGYISGWDLCAPDGTVLARVANTHHLNVGTVRRRGRCQAEIASRGP